MVILFWHLVKLDFSQSARKTLPILSGIDAAITQKKRKIIISIQLIRKYMPYPTAV